MKKLGILIFSSFFLLIYNQIAFSHSLWINATDYNPDFGSEYKKHTKIYFGWGHRFPVDDFITPEYFSDISIISPDGKKDRIDVSRGQYMATRINFEREGTYVISAAIKPGFYTMYENSGKIMHKLEPKTELKNIVLSIYYEIYAKSLIKVGHGTSENFIKPIGQRLEIIPLRNPYTIKKGDYLPVQVLFNGKPARYITVFATYSGFSTEDDFAFATTTDSEGRARIRIIQWGPHLIKAEMKIPATDEYRDKCDELSYTATLTFSIP